MVRYKNSISCVLQVTVIGQPTYSQIMDEEKDLT